MKYEVNVGEVKNPKGNVRGFSSVVFGGSFKVNNITILQNKGESDVSFHATLCQ